MDSHMITDIKELNDLCKNTLVEHLGIIFTEFCKDKLTASMIVNDSIKQPFGIVHGGANCVIAETVGSVAANSFCENGYHAVGQSIHTTHLKAVRRGVIKCTSKAIRIGKTSQVWELSTYDDVNDLTSISILTMAIRKKLS